MLEPEVTGELVVITGISMLQGSGSESSLELSLLHWIKKKALIKTNNIKKKFFLFDIVLVLSIVFCK